MPKANRLSRVTSSRKENAAPRIAVFGVEGVGKSTFASHAPKPLFLDVENGIGQLDVASLPVTSWKDLMADLDALAMEKHDYESVTLDTSDATERMCHRDMCEANKWDTIDAPGYGKGYTYIAEQFRKLLAKLDKIHARGIEVIVLGHMEIKSFTNPQGQDYKRFEWKLHQKVAALFREWVDLCAFAQFETWTNPKTKKAESSGRRVLHTTHCAAWDAKNRYGLPARMPLDYGIVKAAIVGETTPLDVDEIREEYEYLLKTLGTEHEKYDAALDYASENNDDAGELYQGLVRLRELVPQEEDEDDG